MKRGLYIGGAVLLAIIVGVAVYVMSSLDSIVKGAIERYGSEITQADVSVHQVKIEPTSGEGALRGLTVGNPKGFKSDSAFRLGEVGITLDVGTITGDPIIIKKILISGPEITYELGQGSDNLRTLQNNIDAYAAQFSGGGGGDTASEDSGGGPKMVIEDLRIQNGKIEAVVPGTGGDKTLKVKLPNIHLSNLGKKEGGVSPGVLAKKIMAVVTKSASKAVATVNLDAVKGLVGKGVGGVTGTVKKGVTGTMKKGVTGITGGVKKLFGK